SAGFPASNAPAQSLNWSSRSPQICLPQKLATLPFPIIIGDTPGDLRHVPLFLNLVSCSAIKLSQNSYFTRFRPLRRTTKVFNQRSQIQFRFVPTKQHYINRNSPRSPKGAC
ncbi:MAG: hypothetical protein ACTS5P_01000, partial [Candidatus Hodgkinia cicadicola]